MNRRAVAVLAALVLVLLAWLVGPEALDRGSPAPVATGGAGNAAVERASGAEAAKPAEARDARVASTKGFRSRTALDEHFEKHGAEFGAITKDEYLRRAQELRDAKVGGAIRELVRDDGVISRFDTKSGAFGAFDRDGTIRTFFKPNDGLRYFERQAEKEHE